MRTAYKGVVMGVSWGMPQPLQTHIAIQWSADNPSRQHHTMTAAPNAPQSPPRGIQLPPLYPKRFRRVTRGNNAKVRAFHRRDTPGKCETPIGGGSWANAHAVQSSRGGGEWRHPPMALGWVALHVNLRLALGPGSFGLLDSGRAHPNHHSTIPRRFASFLLLLLAAARAMHKFDCLMPYPIMRLFLTPRARNRTG